MLVCAMLCLGSSVHIQAQSVSSSTATSADGNYVEGVVRVKLQREIADRLVGCQASAVSKRYEQEVCSDWRDPARQGQSESKGSLYDPCFPLCR